MQEFKFAVDYKGGGFVKTVYADTEALAWQAVLGRYAGSKDFTVLYQYPDSRHVRTLTEADATTQRVLIKAGGRTFWLRESFGPILRNDVGKRVYLVGDILQVENDAQRDARLGSNDNDLDEQVEHAQRVSQQEWEDYRALSLDGAVPEPGSGL